MAIPVRTLADTVIGRHAAHAIGPLRGPYGPTSAAVKRSSRRRFVRNAMLGAAGIVLVEIVAGAISLLWPLKSRGFGGALSLSSATIPAVNGTPFKVTPGKVYVVHTADGLLALSWKCTHLGCTVPWIEGEQRFHCPCHGSIYLYNGVRIAGPAPRPLDLMPIQVLANGDITVNTNPSDLTIRSDYRPEQATPYPATSGSGEGRDGISRGLGRGASGMPPLGQRLGGSM